MYHSYRGLAFSQPGVHWNKNRSAGMCNITYACLYLIGLILTMNENAYIIALSVLAPKQIKNYMESIHKETSGLVSRLLESTEKNGFTDPYKSNELCFLNVVFTIAFGRRFESTDNPEFLKIIHMIEKSMKFLALEKDKPNFLPIISIIDYFAGTQAEMKHFTDTVRNPTFKKLIEEALMKEGPNVVKSLQEDGFDLSDKDRHVLLCTYMVYTTIWL